MGMFHGRLPTVQDLAESARIDSHAIYKKMHECLVRKNRRYMLRSVKSRISYELGRDQVGGT